MMKINNAYNIWDRVYMITDPNQNRGMITGICVQPTGHFYQVTVGGDTYDCFEMELSKEKNILIGSEKEEE